MPKIERPMPPYMQVIVHIRGQIHSGELRPGDLMPSDRQIASEWGVSRATAQKVITGLRAEGLVETVTGVGTRVLGSEPTHYSGNDRASSVRRTGRIYTTGEYARITAAEITPAPAEVAQVLQVEVGADVIRRVRVTYGADDVARSTSTSWFNGELAEAAPLLLETDRIPRGTWGYLEDQTGRSAVRGQDRISTRLATEPEGEVLGLTLPEAVKVVRTILREEDDGAVLEYGVSISGPDRESIYDYDMS
ncbi:GntR family transcriptional regulator [Streptomyces carpaticus]|uniref:GntR family transcriptional regulator n=1 Tax=Streptomyces carpaticus TaxID=285558 RepID=A0ABV4ZUE5_9ACTN